MAGDLERHIKEGEHLRQDFKFSIEDQKKIARTLAAFANTEGGRLLIGVKDNGKVAGCNPEEELYMIEGAADLYVQPPVPFKHLVHQDQHKLVLEIVVEKSEAKHKAPDETGLYKFYARIDDHTILVNKIMSKVWYLDGKGIAKPEKMEEEALKVLRVVDEAPLTISQIYKKSGLPRKKVDYWLPLFIHWKLVEMEFVEPTMLYFAVG